MKKHLPLLLAVCLCLFFLCSCGITGSEGSSITSTTSEEPAERKTFLDMMAHTYIEGELIAWGWNIDENGYLINYYATIKTPAGEELTFNFVNYMDINSAYGYGSDVYGLTTGLPVRVYYSGYIDGTDTGNAHIGTLQWNPQGTVLEDEWWCFSLIEEFNKLTEPAVINYEEAILAVMEFLKLEGWHREVAPGGIIYYIDGTTILTCYEIPMISTIFNVYMYENDILHYVYTVDMQSGSVELRSAYSAN